MASCLACFRCSSADDERVRRQQAALRELEDIQSKPLEVAQRKKRFVDVAVQPAKATTVEASPSSSVDLESLNGAPSLDVAEPSPGVKLAVPPMTAHAVPERRSSRVCPINEPIQPQPSTTYQSSLSSSNSSPSGNTRAASLSPSPAPSPRTSDHATVGRPCMVPTASSGELSNPSPHSHCTTTASPGAGSESTATPRLLPPLFLMHGPHGAAGVHITPHSARTPAAAAGELGGGGRGCESGEAVPSPHGPTNGGRAPRSSPAAEAGPSPQQPSPRVLEEAAGACAPRLGLTTAKSAPVHGSPPVSGGGGHEGGQEEGASVRREWRRRSEALARVDEEEAVELERPAAAPMTQGGQPQLTEAFFLASLTPALGVGASAAQEVAAAEEERPGGCRAEGCQFDICTQQRCDTCGRDRGPGQDGLQERPRSSAGGGSCEFANASPAGADSRRTLEATGAEAAAATATATTADASAAPVLFGRAGPAPPVVALSPPAPVEPATAAVPSPLQATPQRSSQPSKHAWPAAAVAAARGSRPTSAQPQQPLSHSPAAAPPRASGTPAAAMQQPRPSPSPSSRQPGTSASPVAATPPARRAPFAAASPAAAPARSPAPGPAARGGPAAAGANPFVSVYGAAGSGRLRSTPPPPHAFSMHASASTRLALQDVLSSRRSVNRGGGSVGFSSSVSGLGGNIDFRPKWRF